MENPPCGGIIALRQQLPIIFHAFRGMVVNPEQIIVSWNGIFIWSFDSASWR